MVLAGMPLLHWALDVPYFLLIAAMGRGLDRDSGRLLLACGLGQAAVSAAAGAAGFWGLCACAGLLGLVDLAAWRRLRKRGGP